MVNKDITSYEVGKLQPNLTYEVKVQAAVEEMLGQVVTIVVSTLSYTSQPLLDSLLLDPLVGQDYL